MLTSLCVFCGSRPGHDSQFAAAATQLGHEFVARGIRLIYGGGNVGIMGHVADAVLERGGDVIGVIPEALLDRELAHVGVKDMRIVTSMHTRKALMAELSQGFIALPGGLGTFEELCEILTWGQLGLHQKPVALLNVGNYYGAFLRMLDDAVSAGFLSTRNRELLFAANSIQELMAYFEAVADRIPPQPEVLQIQIERLT